MRRILLISIIAILAGINSSCVREQFLPEPEGGQPAVITLAASGGTRGLLNGSEGDPDYVITSLRIMVFNSGTKLMARNFKIANLSDIPYKLEINTGTYDFVFIANEDSDTELRSGNTLTQVLDAYVVGTNTLTNIMDEYFSSSAFRNDYSIPMTVIHSNVRVNANNTVTLSGNATPETPPWIVEVEHAGIRIDLTLRTDKAITAQNFTQLRILNMPDKVYFFDTKANGTTRNYNDASYEISLLIASLRTFAHDYSISSGVYPVNTNVGDTLKGTDSNGDVILANGYQNFKQVGSDYVWHKRLILPSSFFSDNTNAAKAIQLQAVFLNGRSINGLLGSAVTGTNPHGYVAPRNQRYRMIGTLNADQPIEFTILKVIDWGNTHRIPLNSPWVNEDGGANHRIYIDPNGGDPKLMLTQAFNYDASFFQYGSVIGWNYGNTGVANYNPTNNSALSTWNASWNPGDVNIDDKYHNAANLAAGKGDPCRLVGFTKSEVQAALNEFPPRALDNGEWRLPTLQENGYFITESARSGFSVVNGFNGQYFPNTASLTKWLPAAGRILSSGTSTGQGVEGNYITSNFSTNPSGYYMLNLLSTQTVHLYMSNYRAAAAAARCVPQRPPQPVLASLSVDKDAIMADGTVETLTVTSNAQWIAYIKPGTNKVTFGNYIGSPLLTAFNGGSLSQYVGGGINGTVTNIPLTVTTVDYGNYSMKGVVTILFYDAYSGQLLKEHNLTVEMIIGA